MFTFDGVTYSTTERDCDRVVAAVMTIKNGYLDEKTVAFANGSELSITTSNVDRFAAAFFLAAKESE